MTKSKKALSLPPGVLKLGLAGLAGSVSGTGLFGNPKKNKLFTEQQKEKDIRKALEDFEK